ncbi:MAG TPA: nuclear transport factor 2 family protein [Terriglobales bacterium]|nr:nuclear transport factor 2 family protein [Terriglobales bacterium]
MRTCSLLTLFCVTCVVPLFAAKPLPANTPQQQPTAFQQELIQVQKAFLDAQERGDAEYVKNAVADNFMVIETNGDSSGKDDLVHSVRATHEAGPKAILYDFNVVQLDADCAVVSYKAVFPGTQIERYQHRSDTWVKEGGQWKLKFEQATLNLWSAHDLD